MSEPADIAYVKLTPDGAWHALRYRVGSIGWAGAETTCGKTGEIVAETTGDSRAIRLEHAPVCGRCRNQLDRARGRAIVESTTDDAATSREERSTTMSTTATRERAKAPSTPLTDPKRYGRMSVDELRDERVTISNRLSGVRTQLKRLGRDPERRAELKDRQADLEERRMLIGGELERRQPAEPAEAGNRQLADATRAAAGDVEKAASKTSRRSPRRKS